MYRESLRDQHAIGEEIADAITQGAATSNALDDDELEDELAQMQQEQLDTKMLGAGNVPVSDEVHRLPAAGRAERELSLFLEQRGSMLNWCSCTKAGGQSGGRRGGRIEASTGRDGHVTYARSLALNETDEMH